MDSMLPLWKLLETNNESDDWSEDSADGKAKECLEAQIAIVLAQISIVLTDVKMCLYINMI